MQGKYSDITKWDPLASFNVGKRRKGVLGVSYFDMAKFVGLRAKEGSSSVLEDYLFTMRPFLQSDTLPS